MPWASLTRRHCRRLCKSRRRSRCTPRKRSGRTPRGWQLLLDNQPFEREQWVQPIWLPLPGIGQAGMELVVALPVPSGSYHAVSRIWVGPRDVLEKRWQWRVRAQTTLPQAVSLTLAVLASAGIVG